MTNEERAHRERYRDLGKYARHFSTVRMTLATFFIAISFGLLQFRWDEPDWSFALFVFVFWACGVVLYSFMSYDTFKAEREQHQAFRSFREAAPAAQTAPPQGQPPPGAPQPTAAGDPDENFTFKRNWSGARAIVVATLLFLGLEVWWVKHGEKSAEDGYETTVPVVIQSGESKATTLTVPIKLKIPKGKAGDEKHIVPIPGGGHD